MYGLSLVNGVSGQRRTRLGVVDESTVPVPEQLPIDEMALYHW